ncbi:MAG: 4Fe-4S binding protein [Collinsella sp.]
MVEQHDMFDDIIEISKGVDALKNPFGVSRTRCWAPWTRASRIGIPPITRSVRASTAFRAWPANPRRAAAIACMDVCLVNAIEIEDGAIDVLDSCRKCGLCVAACPTEAFVSPRLQPKKVYDAVARAATAHETAYVTCTRALKRIPRENEVLVACVGDVTRETWFSILTDFPNVSVYLPLDICANCRNACGEEMLGEAIGEAEEWAGRGMGLEVEPRDLKCNKRREYERKEFMDKIVRQTGLTVSKLTPATAAVASVTQRIREHSSRVSALEKTLNSACGVTTQKRRRILTQGRQLMLSTLQQHPELAENVRVQFPEFDHDRCTMCGACVEACPTFACDLLNGGKLAIEPTYCIGCGLCAEVSLRPCPQDGRARWIRARCSRSEARA